MPISALAAPPQFSDYKTTEVATPAGPTPLDLSSPDAYRYRTRLRIAAAEPVNFAGHYRLEQWGCGTSCVTGAILDRTSGSVRLLPFGVYNTARPDDPNAKSLEFEPTSRLLVINGALDGYGPEVPHYYEFTGTALQPLPSEAPAPPSNPTASTLPPPKTETPSTDSSSQVDLDLTLNKKRVTYESDNFWYIRILNKMNSLNIDHVSVNRGNCKNVSFSDGHRYWPHPLKFGETVDLLVSNCDPIEIDILAAEGSSTFTFGDQ